MKTEQFANFLKSGIQKNQAEIELGTAQPQLFTLTLDIMPAWLMIIYWHRALTFVGKLLFIINQKWNIEMVNTSLCRFAHLLKKIFLLNQYANLLLMKYMDAFELFVSSAMTNDQTKQKLVQSDFFCLQYAINQQVSRNSLIRIFKRKFQEETHIEYVFF
jgi:hypothetical protein